MLTQALVQLASKNMNISFDLDSVQLLNDFESDDNELYQNEKGTKKTHYKNSLLKHNLMTPFSSSSASLKTVKIKNKQTKNKPTGKKKRLKTLLFIDKLNF